MLNRRGAGLSRRGMLLTGAFALTAAGELAAPSTLGAAQGIGATVSTTELRERTIERRAIEAAIWAMPIVSFDAMRQAFFRDANAAYADIMFWSRPGSWKLQCLTPNTSVRYVLSFINTRETGPLVFEVPATGDAALNGTIIDAWQVPLTDVGIIGADQGKGGKYLLLPPGHTGNVPTGYIPVPMETHNGLAGLRVILKSEDEESVRKALAYLRLVRIYPLSKSASPPRSNFIDMVNTIWDALPRFDEGFYASLARILSEEPIKPRDTGMTYMLRSLGIEKGKKFQPDGATSASLRAAAQEVHAWFMDRLVTFGDPFWPGGKWDVAVPPIAPQSNFTWEADGILDVDARGIAYYSFFAPPKKLGAGQFYLAAYFDGAGERLRGGETYRLRVPSDVPVDQFWSITVYELATCALIRNAARPSMDSFDTNAKRNADGSLDVYFGPKAPSSLETNWIPTVDGSDWFPYFRLYGPQKVFFAKNWRLDDIKKIS